MYHIYRTRSKVKPFGIVLLASTGEVLSSHAVKTKQAAFKNVTAQLTTITRSDNARTRVQDDTGKVPILYVLNDDGAKCKSAVVAKPRYIPGKNPK